MISTDNDGRPHKADLRIGSIHKPVGGSFQASALLILCIVVSACASVHHITRDVTSGPIKPYLPSTLLPPNTTRLPFSVESSVPATCRYAIGRSEPFALMTPFGTGDGTTRHSVVLDGLSPDPNVVNDVYVRCDAYPDHELKVRYRVLSEVNPPFPRKANLWGWWMFSRRELPHSARIDLWMGAEWKAGQIRELRRLNPHIRVLTSLNAIEPLREVPDRYFLRDIHGRRLEVWPGSYRLNLTKPEVAEFQARHAYQLILDSDLMLDGIFIDNAFLTTSWRQHDIFGNPFEFDADENGIPDDPVSLDAAWSAGVLHELQTIRRLLPHAILSGHSIDVQDALTLSIFNATSIGFDIPEVIEGRKSFQEFWDRYESWQRLAQPPLGTMIESAVPLQIGYGYGYSPVETIPPSTLEFARQYYPYMRFGLASTLLEDGYFAHEIGDTFHGNDWWYDELDFNLGFPLGPAERLGSSLFGPDVFRRDFTNGIVLLNATREPRTITVGPNFTRLIGQQAPLHEYIVDDTPNNFSTSGSWKDVVYDSGEWKAAGPYYHDWGPGSHEGTTGSAQWNLQIPEVDKYTITAWWPAAPTAYRWNDHVRYEIMSGGHVVSSTTLDQRSGGDEWHLIGEVALQPGASLRILCEGGAPCIADALHIRSRKRYNDGSPAHSVTLQPMDGIILQRTR